MINYTCQQCGLSGVKLWRFVEDLLCAKCACDNSRVTETIDALGYRPTKHGVLTDQIGTFVPAVPDKDSLYFWSYTSVPPERVAWWRARPTYSKHAEEGDLLGSYDRLLHLAITKADEKTRYCQVDAVEQKHREPHTEADIQDYDND